MIKPWFIVPVVTVVALGGSFFWWQSERDRWTPPPARHPELPSVAPMPPAAQVRAKQALAMPLFWSSRLPIEVDSKKGGLARELDQARLTAVLESGKDRVAILQRADGTTLKITNASKPWRVESFDGRKAVFLAAGDQSVEKLLEVQTPVAAKSQNPSADRSRKPLVAR